jgi:hypothetical protein
LTKNQINFLENIFSLYEAILLVYFVAAIYPEISHIIKNVIISYTAYWRTRSRNVRINISRFWVRKSRSKKEEEKPRNIIRRARTEAIIEYIPAWRVKGP